MSVVEPRVVETFLPPEDGRPLYRRLLASLRDDIESGRLRPGDLIPPEVEIARRHGISRHTVRQAIVELARQGLLRRERGRGTFVSQTPVIQPLSTLYSFAHEMRDRGLSFSTRVLHRRQTAASALLAERLDIAAGDPIVEIEILRLVQESPLSLEFVVARYDRFPALMDFDFDLQSVYEVMAEKHGVTVTLGREEIRPVVLDRRQASLLEVPAGSPAFHVDRLTYAGTDPVEWRRSLIRGDRYLFRIELPVRERSQS